MADLRQAVEKTRTSWFRRIGDLLRRPQIDEEVWQELEEVLIGADVGLPATLHLVERVKERLKREKGDGRIAGQALEAEIAELLKLEPIPLPATRPWVILMTGVNGSGKTTSIAKLAHRYVKQGKRVLLAAADTFRAAAIDQLKIWGDRVGAEVIAHQPGADPGAVVYDSIEAAYSRGHDVLIVDTAGRLHTKYNLMEELKKIKRVASRRDSQVPHQVLLVLDATTGQNGLAQAKAFTQAVGVNGIFLAKLDSTAKGGIVLAIAQELHLPILYVGTGQGVEDMALFDPQAFAHALCSP
ncbi:MAG: signal recognition particle-docking protein FtsY [Chloroflexota bacterium]